MRFIAQLSLEYLLVLAAAFAVFAVFLPLLNGIYAASLFGLDALNAGAFSSALQQSIEEMAFQADGSLSQVEARPLTSWLVSLEGERLLVSVKGPGSREKLFEVFFPNKAGSWSYELKSKKVFFLWKESGNLLLEYN